jgi:hypothetical protein
MSAQKPAQYKKAQAFTPKLPHLFKKLYLNYLEFKISMGCYKGTSVCVQSQLAYLLSRDNLEGRSQHALLPL